jgi:hypothetical protein
MNRKLNKQKKHREDLELFDENLLIFYVKAKSFQKVGPTCPTYGAKTIPSEQKT